VGNKGGWPERQQTEEETGRGHTFYGGLDGILSFKSACCGVKRNKYFEPVR
jgi:hypothetical protein